MNPIITIITVAYNAENTIEKTILSVIQQTYLNIEYIVIDGNSSDGTVDIIKKYSNKISYWVSEPDKGIYDAMNKGIKLATGKWINFMNCGDTFYSNKILEDVFNSVDNDADIIYGDVNTLYKTGAFIEKARPVSQRNYMPFCHQSSFVKSDILKNNKFDLAYRICADRNLFYKLYNSKCKYLYINKTIANYENENGVSSTNVIRVKYELYKIEGKDKDFKYMIKFFCFAILHKAKQLIYTILPDYIVQSKTKRCKK